MESTTRTPDELFADSLVGAGENDVYLKEHQGFQLGQKVSARDWSGEWIIAEIFFSENGCELDQPFRLRSTRADEATRRDRHYGSHVIRSEEDRHMCIWAAADELKLLEPDAPAPSPDF